VKTFEEYWAALVKKNPAFGRAEDAHVTLTARGLKAVVKQAWDKGELSMAQKTAKAFSGMDRRNGESPLDALNNIFGFK
jgi:hypothetical protein